MLFNIAQTEAEPNSYWKYEYNIFRGDKLVAHYRHDFRGDAHEIIFIDGRSISMPVGSVTDFIIGGGPKPLLLSKAAIDFLNNNLEAK